MVAGQFVDRRLRIDRYRVSRCGHRESGRARYSHADCRRYGRQCGHADPDRRRARLGG